MTSISFHLGILPNFVELMFSQANQIDIVEIQFNIYGALVALFELYVGNVQRVQGHKVNTIKT